jgi:hypothetical protein
MIIMRNKLRFVPLKSSFYMWWPKIGEIKYRYNFYKMFLDKVRVRDRFMVFNATFSNMSAISWRSILLVDEAGVPGEKPLMLPDLILFIYVTVFSVVKVLGPVLIQTL